MPINAKVEGLDRFKRRVRALVGPTVIGEALRANRRNADEFENLVRSIIPKGEPEAGHITDSLTNRQIDETAVEVAIGGPGTFHYPMHLEAGHRNRDGSVTPGKPFWNPARRVVARRAKNRTARAARAAIKRAVSGS